MEKHKPNKLFDKQFGSYIKKKRLQRDWTQVELASRIGNNYQNISRLERGEITPTLFWCYTLADAFEMKLIPFLKDFDYTYKG